MLKGIDNGMNLLAHPIGVFRDQLRVSNTTPPASLMLVACPPYPVGGSDITSIQFLQPVTTPASCNGATAALPRIRI